MNSFLDDLSHVSAETATLWGGRVVLCTEWQRWSKLLIETEKNPYVWSVQSNLAPMTLLEYKHTSWVQKLFRSTKTLQEYKNPSKTLQAYKTPSGIQNPSAVQISFRRRKTLQEYKTLQDYKHPSGVQKPFRSTNILQECKNPSGVQKPFRSTKTLQEYRHRSLHSKGSL